MSETQAASGGVKVTPPFAYGEIVPLLKQHRVAVEDGIVAPALRKVQAVPISMSEMGRAARDYPIAFSGTPDGKRFGVIALLGLRQDENRLVDDAGRWREGWYVPAYVRRYPFCMASVTDNGQQRDERVVCVERGALAEGDGGRALEDEAGKPQAWWEERLKLTQEFEADLLRTARMCDILSKFGLLVPFSAQAVSKSGDTMNITGLFRGDEGRLDKLRADDLRMLIRTGTLGRLYAQMFSLDNLGRLLDLG